MKHCENGIIEIATELHDIGVIKKKAEIWFSAFYYFIAIVLIDY